MKYPLIIFSFLCLLSQPALSQVHFDLDVNVDLNEREIKIRGTSSQPALDPIDHIEKTEFSYSWPLPDAMAPEDWQGGVFASVNELYLPGGWHPQTSETVTFDVRVQSPIVVILPGAISEERHTSESYQARFLMVKPSEGIPLFAGPYRISEMQTDHARLRTYFYDGMDDLSTQYLHRTAQYLNRFARQIGPYPFKEFHIIASPVGAGYGFAGLTYMGKRVLSLPFILESSLGHEILHNYWGNAVFPDYAKGNWAEGLTTYMADYMTAEAASFEKARDMRLSWLRDYASLPTHLDRPVSEFVTKHGQASQVIGYNKVAFIFHMLRETLGDQAFFASLRLFWKEYAFKTASWSDLKASFEKSTSQDLSDFFQQWVYQAGAPKFKNLSARSKHHPGKGWEVSVRVVQDKPAFKTILPLSVGTSDGISYQKTALSTRVAQSTFWLTERPHAISLDADFNLFRKLGPNEAPPILRDVMLAENVHLLLLSPSLEEGAKQLAAHLIENGIVAMTQDSETHPFVLIGLEDDVAQKLKSARLPPHPLPEMIASASVWAGKTHKGAPYMVISVKDEASLQALMRPLSHYGKRATLLFDGAKAIYKSTGQTRPIAVPIN